MDQMILEVQKWLNITYKGIDGFKQIPENGQTGWTTTNALLVALQIEEGVNLSTIKAEIDSGNFVFGESTKANFIPLSASTDYSLQSNKNKLMILQGGFWCKGISPGSFGPIYTPKITEAIETLQRNAGIEQTGVADVLVFQALLSMDQFVVIKRLGGDENIAELQRSLNSRYATDRGFLIPCDGIYGRELNKALIYALQRTEGLSSSDANRADGYFGKKTQEKCPVLKFGESNYFVKLLQYALYCNGFTNLSFSGTFDEETRTEVLLFQNRMGIVSSEGRNVNLDTWMALLLSSGNPDIKVKGCDAAQTISPSDAKALKANGYEIIGRYISGRFATTTEELTGILNGGLNVFPIYETGGYEPSYFVKGQGEKDAIHAVESAESLGIPEGTIIYFTVDYDMEGYQIDNLVIPYFKEIYDKFNEAQLSYRIGIYGARNVCSKVINNGYAQVAFVAGASTGFSGNMGFPMPSLWSFNQVKVDTSVEGIGIDKDQVSGLDNGFSYIKKGNNIEASNKTVQESKNTPKEEEELKKFFEIVTQNFLNLKLEFDTDKHKIFKLINDKKYFGAYPIAEDSAYLRFEEGYKLQLLSGDSINVYFNKGDFSVDILRNSSGVNIVPKEFVESQTIKDMIKSVIPTASKGSIQFYPYWRRDEGSIPGYYELGVEIGIEITDEMVKQLFDLNDKSDKIANLIGEYFYLDVILGLKLDTFDFLKYEASRISNIATMTMLLNILVNLKNKAIEFVDGTINAITDGAKELLDALTNPDNIYNFFKQFLIDALGLIITASVGLLILFA